MNPAAKYGREDFDHSPMLVFYELTRACDLACKHCRADAQALADPNELSTAQAKQLIMQLSEFPKKPLLVMTGGDPLKRPDVFELLDHAVSSGHQVAMTPSATPLVTREAIRRLAAIGLHRLAVSLDGADAATHDGFRQVQGSYQRTMEIIADAKSAGIPVQINTTIAHHNLHQIDDIAELLIGLSVELWSVFFLIPIGRGLADQRLSEQESEGVFERLHHHSKYIPIKTTEAPHYRRFLLQKFKADPVTKTGPAARWVGTNDGKGILFVSHTGEIYPSGFLPICCGKFPLDSLVRVYQTAKLFQALRDTDQLTGKCGVCEYKEICGGSRARAFAMTGDPLAAEPDCAYTSPRWSKKN